MKSAQVSKGWAGTVRQRRLEHGWSIRELERRSGVSAQTIRNIESDPAYQPREMNRSRIELAFESGALVDGEVTETPIVVELREVRELLAQFGRVLLVEQQARIELVRSVDALRRELQLRGGTQPTDS